MKPPVTCFLKQRSERERKGDGVVRTIFMILASRLVMRTILTNFEDCLTLFVWCRCQFCLN